MKKLESLLADIDYECTFGTTDKEIESVVYDSRVITKNCLFICIKGARFDGHEAIAEAIEKGAAAVLVQENSIVANEFINTTDHEELAGMTVITVKNTRYAMAFVSAAWFDNPASKLTTIGITGTKGKTTTTYLVKSILEKAGFKVGLVGTIEIMDGVNVIPAVNTTPESYLLQQYFANMVANGVEIVVMEVSSQGLMMHRAAGFMFDYGIFTNLEPDHIGPNEHASFDEYLACKSMLFRQCRVGIVNGDDAHVEEILKNHTCEVETFGFGEANDIKASNVSLVKEPGYIGVEFDVSGIINMHLHAGLPGKFSVYNILTTLAICRHFGVAEEVLREALYKANVKGRIEVVRITEDIVIMIDYAHNKMALRSVLETIRAYEPQRLICIFGCGGNRSRERRFEMGEVSGEMADFTIITSDNPRFEEPLDIIADIETGIQKTNGEYIKIPDRKAAIEYSISHARPGDVIILAGKGHEDYQEIKGVKYPMDERVIIKEILDSGIIVGGLA